MKDPHEPGCFWFCFPEGALWCDDGVYWRPYEEAPARLAEATPERVALWVTLRLGS